MRLHLPAIALVATLCAAAAVSADEADKTEANVKDNHATLTHFCPESGKVTFTGSDNTIEVHGSCDEVVLVGSRNIVTVDNAVSLQVQGDDNRIAWDAAHTGVAPPKALVAGVRNSVKREGE
ncbi:MAG TPA: DUF3060 domain-containing protein [Rhodanobacteraceae bacterium]|nr:DUF3060 domain-containing protein [Rhodanobacteraceae bacterium]